MTADPHLDSPKQMVPTTGFCPPSTLRVARILARAAAAALALVAVLAADSALADLTLAPRQRGEPPMRILRVTSADPACQPNCPEWISAEGIVTPGEAQDFAKIIEDLGGRRLPTS